MKQIPLAELEPLVRGAQDLQRTAEGFMPRRLPKWLDAQMPDPGLDMMARMTAGVRLVFETDATAFELDVLETGLQVVGEERREAAFDLYVDGAFSKRQLAREGRTIRVDRLSVPPALSIAPGTPSTLTFDGLPAGSKTVELWLPQSASVELSGFRVTDGAQVRPVAPQRPQWLHYGSSISHGMEASGPSATWPSVAARLMGLELTSFGFAGQCLIDGAVARAMRDVTADFISLKLGINVVNWDAMRERAFVPAVHSFLDMLRDVHKTTPILVISPIFCPLVETLAGPTLRSPSGIYVPERSAALSEGALSTGRIRQLLSAIVERRRSADPNLQYLDGLKLFASDDAADLPDLLHPNAAGLVRMGERFAALARSLALPGRP